MRELWIKVGMKAGWISPPYCSMHDSNYNWMTDEDIKELEDGGDPCHVVMSLIELNN